MGLIVRSVAFERMMLAFIVLSTGLLSYETYPSAVGATRATLDMLNLVCRCPCSSLQARTHARIHKLNREDARSRARAHTHTHTHTQSGGDKFIHIQP